MPGHPSTTHACSPTIADAHAQSNLDAHSASTHANVQSQPQPSPTANLRTRFTAGISFGPSVFRDMTTNRPDPQFLGSLSNSALRSFPALVKLEVPDYLSTNRDDTHKLAESNTAVDAFRYYLCASLARHHGYRTACQSDATTTPLYRPSYKRFEKNTSPKPFRTTRNIEPTPKNNKRPSRPSNAHLTYRLRILSPSAPFPPPPPPNFFFNPSFTAITTPLTHHQNPQSPAHLCPTSCSPSDRLYPRAFLSCS